jgi:hypothetical protein
MRTISLHVDDDHYQRFKHLAATRKRPITELIREAMRDFLLKEPSSGMTLENIPARDCGAFLTGWTRGELYDEMLEEWA